MASTPSSKNQSTTSLNISIICMIRFNEKLLKITLSNGSYKLDANAHHKSSEFQLTT